MLKSNVRVQRYRLVYNGNSPIITHLTSTLLQTGDITRNSLIVTHITSKLPQLGDKTR
jgi:hypothetical protein